jgi:large subunit ribosomal protein L25
MANVVTIEAEARARAGKGAARATRRAGKVPAVIYGAHKEPSLIALDPRAVLRELTRPGWQSRLYEIKVNGDATQALISDVQFHPVSDAPDHVDFQRLAPGERIRVSVPVHFDNDGLSPGLKRGGVLNVIRHTVQVYTQPEHIPEQFTADLASLDFNDAVRWEDLKGTENTRPTIAPTSSATVALPTKQTEVRPSRRRRPRLRRRRPHVAAAERSGADPPRQRKSRQPKSCCSGSASAIRNRGWPGTGITSASWRWTRSRSVTGSARGDSASRAL